MKPGDLVRVYDPRDDVSVGLGIFLAEIYRQHTNYYKFLWKGRIAEFDRTYWDFEVIESI